MLTLSAGRWSKNWNWFFSTLSCKADIVELAKIPGTQVSEYTAARIAAKIFAHRL